MSNVRRLLRELAPPIVLDAYRRLRGGPLRFTGDYSDWSAARRDASGYDSHAIVERIAQATQAVMAGRAVFERDSVLFDVPDYPYPLLSGLLLAASVHRGELEVIDFGGALGGLYRQCRPFLGGLAKLRWTVVEQPVFAERGRREFQTGQLDFADALPVGPRRAATVLASSVLQYLEDPADALRQFSATGASHLLIDRTPWRADAQRNQLCVQHVPAEIYEASYPCWIFSRSWLDDVLAPDWRLVAEFDAPEGTHRPAKGKPFEFKGMILERRTV